MNREKEDQLPMMQVGFIDSICMPIYEVRTANLKWKPKQFVKLANFSAGICATL